MNATEIIEGAVFVVSIALWGIWEYRERELTHRQAIFNLRKDIEPNTHRLPNWVKVGTTASVSIIMLGVVVAGIVFVAGLGHYRNPFLYIILINFAAISVLLMMMATRDIKILRRS